MDSIKKILDSDSGLDLKRYLAAKLLELKFIDNLKMSLNPIKMAIEVRATKKAFNKLQEIITELGDFSTELKENDPKDSYH